MYVVWQKTEFSESAHGDFGELRNSRIMTRRAELVSRIKQLLYSARDEWDLFTVVLIEFAEV